MKKYRFRPIIIKVNEINYYGSFDNMPTKPGDFEIILPSGKKVVLDKNDFNILCEEINEPKWEEIPEYIMYIAFKDYKTNDEWYNTNKLSSIMNDEWVGYSEIPKWDNAEKSYKPDFEKYPDYPKFFPVNPKHAPTLTKKSKYQLFHRGEKENI